MYGLAIISRTRDIEFDEAGQPQEYVRGTGESRLCDVGVGGTLLCLGTREMMQQLADALMREYPWEYRAVPLPWAGVPPTERDVDRMRAAIRQLSDFDHRQRCE